MFHTGFLSFLGFFHIGYDVFDVVGRTVFAVPVIAYPQVGFIVGVEAFVEIFQFTQKPVEIPVFHFNRDVEILPFGRILLKIEHHSIFVLRVDACQPNPVATAIICSVVVIVSFFISLCSELFSPPQGRFYVRYPTAEARTANKEPPMKFYEIPGSVISESFRQISAR